MARQKFFVALIVSAFLLPLSAQAETYRPFEFKSPSLGSRVDILPLMPRFKVESNTLDPARLSTIDYSDVSWTFFTELAQFLERAR